MRRTKKVDATPPDDGDCVDDIAAGFAAVYVVAVAVVVVGLLQMMMLHRACGYHINGECGCYYY